ncbi:MAG: amidohydrolase [Candidatus Latescibacterota bacterium]
MSHILAVLFSGMLVLAVLAARADGDDRMDRCKRESREWIDANRAVFEEAAIAIHGFAETRLGEYRSAEYLAVLLERNGFRLERGVAEMPTAFVATFGSGKPVIGFLAEYDALPGLSQKAAATAKEPLLEGGPGHGCGHNLLGTANVAAVVAMKQVMEKRQLTGTVKLFGCPAEEGTLGKVYMAKAGVFEGVDVCFAWHPGAQNAVRTGSSLAKNEFEVVFHGKTAHAAADPWSGRSALDAVEIMSVGVNYLREHIEEQVRIHSVITQGGKAPNIVPDRASAWYYVRDLDRTRLEAVYNRVLDCARGAALMTGTTLEVNVITGVYEYLPNRTLSEVLYRNLREVGVPQFTAEDHSFARGIQRSLGVPEKGMSTEIDSFGDDRNSGASTDVADVSWIVPTSGELGVATNPQGSPGHSWAVTASSGSPAGLKGMLAAAKTLASGGVETLLNPEIVPKAKAEFAEKTKGFTYRSAIPEGQKPPVPERK